MTQSANLKIDLNARSKDEIGCTAFHYACVFGRRDIITMMIEHAESSNLNFKIKDKFGATAFQVAEWEEKHDIVDLMKRKLPAGTF